MAVMSSMEGTLRTSCSFKKRGLKNFTDESDHEQDNAVVVGTQSISFKKKKPKMLELQMTAVSALGTNGSVCGLVGNDDELVKEADSILFSSNEQAKFLSSKPAELHAAATKLQKFYKSYRTRRNLADCAVVVEELWWKALEFAALRRSSVSFFNSNKSETAVSRWARARTRAAKVGKGLLKDVKGQQLALRHWLEAIDPRHRYGHNLHLYYDVWFESASYQPFFYWLDVGEGKEVSVDKCPRMNLQRECIKYLGPKEREAYEVMLERGKLIYKQSKMAVNTVEGSKWIFVLSTSRILYVGLKEKGHFHHSSFLSGGATISSGRLVVRHGTLHAVWAYSGHYRPTEENFMELCTFLEEHQVDLTNVKKCPIDDDIPSKGTIHEEQKAEPVKETSEKNMPFSKAEILLCCSNSDKIVEKAGGAAAVAAYESKYKWSTAVGARIGCVRDYPARLQFKALEQVNLSPRPRVKPPSTTAFGPIASPKLHLSPTLAYLGLVSPRVRVSASN